LASVSHGGTRILASTDRPFSAHLPPAAPPIVVQAVEAALRRIDMMPQFRQSLAVTAALLAGSGFSSFGQTGSPQTDTYLAKLQAENARHAAVNLQLKNARVDAVTQRESAEIDCSAQTGSQKQTCMNTALTNYQATIRNIDKQQATEDGTHQKNINALIHTTDASCTRPDCANLPPAAQQSKCTGQGCGQD
jgi:hypothetical protein